MRKKTILIVSCFLVWNLGLYSQEKLEIEGAIQIGQSEDATPDSGTIQWTGSDFQVWNGSKWISLTSGVTFKGEVTDIDGNVYQTVVIGNQEWMVQNLRTRKYRDGSTIPQVTGNTAWSNATYGAWCWYDNDNSYEEPYGKLYNWHAVNDGRGLCPAGWHIPVDTTEWDILTYFLGGLGFAGGPMKEATTAHWNSPNTGATNASGFTGLSGGGRDTDGSFGTFGFSGYWWSSSAVGSVAWYRKLTYNSEGINRFGDDKTLGLSVRCVRD